MPGQERSEPGRGLAAARGADQQAGDQRPAERGTAERGTARGADGGDDLWPPLSLSALDRDARVHARLRQQAGREPPPRGRGRNRLGPPLSRAEIVDAAIAVADAEGAEAISMRRIAQVLRAGTMSLYWHVANKEHLLDLMLDALVAEDDIPEPSGDWRADLQALARSQRAMLHRHLWAMEFMGGRPPLGPNTLLSMEHGLATVDGLGLGTVSSLQVLETVMTYVLGAVLREMREIRGMRDQEQARITKEEWEPLRQAWRDRLAADGRFKRVVGFIDERIDPDSDQTREERFEFGLTCVLDGIAASLPAAAAARQGTRQP